jgi:MFS family permease
MVPAALSLVMNMFEEGAERNKALGIWGGLAAGGATVGLIAGGLLTRYAGWQYIFYLNVPIGTAALALAPRLVPDSRLAAGRRRFDALGGIVGTGGLVLLVDAVANGPRYGWGATRTMALLAGSVALLVAFAAIESRAKEPLLPLSVFRLRTLAGANIAGLLAGGSFFGFIFVGTLYMQQVLHYSALETGVAWLAGSLSSIALPAPRASPPATPTRCFAPATPCPRLSPTASIRHCGCSARSRCSPSPRSSRSSDETSSRTPSPIPGSERRRPPSPVRTDPVDPGGSHAFHPPCRAALGAPFDTRLDPGVAVRAPR